jgi:hypothetical protein
MVAQTFLHLTAPGARFTVNFPSHYIAIAATLCGMGSYKAISGWANALGLKARERFGCRIVNRVCVVPSLSIIRGLLIRVMCAACFLTQMPKLMYSCPGSDG